MFMDKMLTIKDIQGKLHLGRTNTYKLVNKKGFPKIIIGKKILIPETEFEKYIMNHLRSTIELE